MYIYFYVHLHAKYIHQHLIYTVPFIYRWKLYILAVKIYYFDWLIDCPSMVDTSLYGLFSS